MIKKEDTWLASKFIKRSSAITYMYDSDKRNTFCYPSIRIAKNYANLHQSRSLELFYTRRIYIKWPFAFLDFYLLIAHLTPRKKNWFFKADFMLIQILQYI